MRSRRRQDSVRSVISKIPPAGWLVLLFLAVFAWFFCTEWYAPAQLIISGKSPGQDGLLKVGWESGAGYNRYEARKFLLNTFPDEGGDIQISIRYTGTKNSASMDSQVVCSGITIDGRNVNFSSVSFQGENLGESKGIRLFKPGDHIKLEVKAEESIAVQMDTNNGSGMVEIEVSGKTADHDLYIANIEAKFLVFQYWIVGPDKGFRLRMDMPRYPINSLTITNGNPQRELLVDSIRIATEKEERILYTGPHERLEKQAFRRVSGLQKRYFHSMQFLLQVLFAILTTWILFACWRFYVRCRSTGGIFSPRRRVFWALFLVSMIAFSAWLLAFWPGVMSVDSLKIWRAAVLPEVYLNDHPLLNVILYRYLAGIWNNPAIVPMFHISVMSGLSAYIFYQIHRQGVSLKLLAPLYLLLITSIPVGLYNVMLWKDIPFAMLIIFCAFFLTDFFRRKQEKSLILSGELVFALLLLLLALAFTRHNGLVYLAVVPVYFLILGLAPRKKILGVAAVMVCVGVTGAAIFAFLGNGHIANGNYLFSQGGLFLNNLLQKSFIDLGTETWRNYWGIFNINQKESAWDLWHYFLRDRFSYVFLIHTGWSDVYRFLADGPVFPQLTDIAMNIYRKSYETPFVYLTWNPVHFLVLYLLAVLSFPKFRLTAIFSSLILVQVLTLIVFVDVMNWRYYYFAFLGGYFIIPLLLLDIQRKKAAQGDGRRVDP